MIPFGTMQPITNSLTHTFVTRTGSCVQIAITHHRALTLKYDMPVLITQVIRHHKFNVKFHNIQTALSNPIVLYLQNYLHS